jgi:hypothetical protein
MNDRAYKMAMELEELCELAMQLFPDTTAMTEKEKDAYIRFIATRENLRRDIKESA